MKITPENVSALAENEFFVFGSNLNGYHGAGAAYTAHKLFDAEMGVGEGITGKCYAFPTKDKNMNPVSIADFSSSVKKLKEVINANPNKHFLITRVGCGLAGFRDYEVAPLFKEFLELPNVSLPSEFLNILINEKS